MDDLFALAIMKADVEDRELLKLLKQMHIPHAKQVAKYIRDIGDTLQDVLAMDREEVIKIAHQAVDSGLTQYIPAVWLTLHLAQRTFLDDFQQVSKKLLNFWDFYAQQINLDSGGKKPTPGDELDSVVDTLQDITGERAAYKKWLDGLGNLMNRKTKNDVSNLIRKGLEAGWDIDRMEAEMEKLEAFSYKRARRTALTETLRGQTSAQYCALMENDNVIAFRWNHLNSKSPRENHVAMQGQQVFKGDTFDVSGYPARFPRDYNLPPEESVNCHCYIDQVMRADLSDLQTTLDKPEYFPKEGTPDDAPKGGEK